MYKYFSKAEIFVMLFCSAAAMLYRILENHRHSKEIHSAFSIRKRNIGDEIRIRVSEADPESIIVVFSDTAMAIIMSIPGFLFELILFELYIHIS